MLEEKRILVIDDDVDFAYLLQLACQEAGIPEQVDIVHDGWAALRYLNGNNQARSDGPNPPALILLDLRMPGLSGLEVLNWIRSHSQFEHVPVIILTGLESEQELAKLYQSRATAVRIKPFTYRDLVSQVNELGQQYLEHSEEKHAA